MSLSENTTGLEEILEQAQSLPDAGGVELTAENIEAALGYKPADADAVPSKTSELTNDSGFITGYTETDPTVPAWAKAASKPSYTKSEVGLGNVENVKQYSASNPPPYPVSKVNGKTGVVSLTADDVGALPASTVIPTVVQATGDSTTAVMSQTAVTKELNQLSNEKVDNPLYGKKVSFLGDSICAGGTESTSYLGGYGKIIADRNGMIYENVARAGSTITAEVYSSSGVAKGWISRMVENMSADADYAIIEGGINDAWQWYDHQDIEIGEITQGYKATLDDTTYYGAFESMLKQLVTRFRGKKIGYIAVPKMMDLYDSNRKAPNFYHIALECCAKWGVPVCDLNTITPPFEYLKTLGTEYTADGTHPTYEGYLKYYCDPIEAWMKTLTTGASVSVGSATATPDLDDLDNRYIKKDDIQIKKAQLTLEDGSTILIDVVVASAGTTIQKYLNLVPTSIDTDGSIYNGVGYKYHTRLSSSGVEKAQDGAVATGFIPAVGGDVIRLGGDYPWYVEGLNNNYLCAYDKNFAFIGAVYNTIDGFSYTKNIAASYELGAVTKVTLIADSNIAYIRASYAGSFDYTDAGTFPIVTVNQEIT